MHHVEASGERFELLAAEMQDRSDAGGAVAEFPRVRLDQRDQALHVLHRQRGIDREQRRRHPDLRDRREVADRIVRHLGIEARIDRVGRHRRDEERVAVRRGLRDHVGAEIAARAAPVLDHELLAEEFTELVRHDPADDVGRTASRERHHQANGL